MSVQPVLAVRSRGSSAGAPDPQLAVMDNSGAQPVSIGSTFGTKEFASNAQAWAHNKAIRFKGFLYVLVNGSIYRTSAASPGTPTLVHAFASALTNPDAHLGLYVRLIAGVPTLVTAYNVTATSTWNVVRSSDGTSWTENAITGLVNMGSVAVGKVGVFRNQFYWFVKHADNGHFTASIDPENVVGALQTTSLNNPDGYPGGDFCEYNGIFYCISAESNAVMSLLALNGSTWAQAGPDFLPGTDLGFGGPRAQPGADTFLFADGLGNMIAIYVVSGNAGSGLMCVNIVDTGGGTLTFTDITGATMPSSWRITSNVTVIPTSSNLSTAMYQELDSATAVVTTHLWVALGNAPGTQWGYYPWNGISTLIGTGGNANDIGGDTTYTLPHTKLDSFQGGSQYVYDVSLPEVWITEAPAQGLLGEVHRFSLSAQGGAAKDYREWFTREGKGDYRNGTRATFLSCRRVSGTGADPTLSSDKKTVQGCTGDGTTVYEAVWDTIANGVAALDRGTTFPEVV